MITDPQTASALILGSALLCQWLGARLRVPSVLFLLLAGVAVGTVVDPDEIFGEILFTGVSFGVAILLFEGGTSLDWSALGSAKNPVLRLVTIGVLVSWVVGMAASLVLIDIDPKIAVLLAAILTVSGPTVIMPLLRVVRPREPSGSVLRWEGILIDPVGAGLAIVVLDAIIEDRSLTAILIRIATTFGAGAATGLIFTAALIGALRARIVPDHLHIPITLGAVIGAFAVANLLRPEAGLLAVTILGMGFANQKNTPAGHITEFNENLGAVVLGVLFVVLGARIDLGEVADGLLPAAALAVVLMVIARPLAVLASTVGTQLRAPDRKFLMVMAPRGVVAAAVASLFAIELEHEEIDPGPLVPTVFTVVVVTVAVASLVARAAAHRLRVGTPDPRGVALVGGSPFAMGLARALSGLGVPTMMIGLNEESASEAAMEGLLVYQGRLDSPVFHETVMAVGIAKAVALSGTDHLDAYATGRVAEEVGSSNIYGLPANESAFEDESPGHARMILPEYCTPELLDVAFGQGASVEVFEAPWVPNDGWLAVCKVLPDHTVTFRTDGTDAVAGEHVVALGPGVAKVVAVEEDG